MKRRSSSATKKGPGRRSLHVTLFASTAAVTLLGLVALAEVSIWQHRALALDALAHDGKRIAEETPANAPEAMRQGGEAGNAGAEGGVPRNGLDATRLQADLVASARQTRQAQAIIAAMVLLGLWLVTRRALAPIEMLADAAERLAEGQSPDEAVPTRSAEARRLQTAISKLAARRSPAPDSLRGGSPADTTRRSTSDVLHTEPDARRLDAIEPTPSSRPPQRSTFRESCEDGAAMRILLVEDNPVNRTVAVRMLEDLGCSVVCAIDGIEALAVFEAECFDLVFMDIQMPRMDGLEATRRIRAAEDAQASEPTPIVALTAHFQPSDQLASRRVGMNGHIAKPFSASDLEDALVEWCDSTKSAASAEAVARAAHRPSPATSEVLDLDSIRRTLDQCGGDAEFLEGLVEAFSRRSGSLAKDCQRALAEHDFERIEAVAHELKSSSGQLGAVRLQEVACEIESLATARDGELSRLIEPLLAEVEHAVRALRALVVELDPAS